MNRATSDENPSHEAPSIDNQDAADTASEQPDTNMNAEVPKYKNDEILAPGFDLKTDSDHPDIRNAKYKTAVDHLNCPICQQPFIKPVTTICGHTFCRECIHECFRTSRTGDVSPLKGSCPLDRTPIDTTNPNDLFPTPLIITNLIDDLKVFCLNSDRGCEWNGCRWELENHVLSCEHTGVKCGGRRAASGSAEKESVCSVMVERRFLVGHEGECAHRVFECSFCNTEVTLVSQQEHLESECLFNYQTCDLCSNDMIPLRHLEKHKENCQKSGHHRCPAHTIGCTWSGNSELALEIHLQNNNCQLSQFLPFYETLSSKVDNLTAENTFLQKQINKILDSIIQGKITNLGYAESIEEISKFDLSSTEDQGKLIYLNYELDRLKFDMDNRVIPYITNSERESVISNLVNDNFAMRDELNMQRVYVSSLRKQLQFLLFTRRGNAPYMGLNGTDGDLDFDVPSRSSSEERLNLKL
ncbi:TNF receptor-associated factor 4 [Meyerozyma sp. JA9]|nr:TNF receptor-associated factor 4 [Meyerozyma sp. JA9]